MFIFQVAASIKDKVERELGEGGWQCEVYFPFFFFLTFSFLIFFFQFDNFLFRLVDGAHLVAVYLPLLTITSTLT